MQACSCVVMYVHSCLMQVKSLVLSYTIMLWTICSFFNIENSSNQSIRYICCMFAMAVEILYRIR